jgi:hypothetical protein
MPIENNRVLWEGVAHTRRKIVKLIAGLVIVLVEWYLCIGEKGNRRHHLSNNLILYIVIQS